MILSMQIDSHILLLQKKIISILFIYKMIGVKYNISQF